MKHVLSEEEKMQVVIVKMVKMMTCNMVEWSWWDSGLI